MRILSIHPHPSAVLECVLGVLVPPPWWWAPGWTDDAEVSRAAHTDAAAVLVNLLGSENNCKVLLQRHSQVNPCGHRELSKPSHAHNTHPRALDSSARLPWRFEK